MRDTSSVTQLPAVPTRCTRTQSHPAPSLLCLPPPATPPPTGSSSRGRLFNAGEGEAATAAEGATGAAGEASGACSWALFDQFISDSNKQKSTQIQTHARVQPLHTNHRRHTRACTVNGTQMYAHLHLLRMALMLFCCAREGGGNASSNTLMMVVMKNCKQVTRHAQCPQSDKL